MSDRPTLEDLIEVRRQLKLPHEALVDKDWLVVRALAAITSTDTGPFQLVFQGGTALSRAHRVIERMSEDVDNTLYRLPYAADRSGAGGIAARNSY